MASVSEVHLSGLFRSYAYPNFQRLDGGPVPPPFFSQTLAPRVLQLSFSGLFFVPAKSYTLIVTIAQSAVLTSLLLLHLILGRFALD